jgi:hypothetical protein
VKELQLPKKYRRRKSDTPYLKGYAISIIAMMDQDQYDCVDPESLSNHPKQETIMTL